MNSVGIVRIDCAARFGNDAIACAAVIAGGVIRHEQVDARTSSGCQINSVNRRAHQTIEIVSINDDAT